MATMEIRVLKPLPNHRTGRIGKKGHKPGDVIKVVVNPKDGIPRSRYWRDRLKDAKIDQCCEIVTKSKSTPKPAGDK